MTEDDFEIPAFLKREKSDLVQNIKYDINNAPIRNWVMPEVKTRPLTAMQRDLAALEIVKAVREGYFTFQKLRKLFDGKLDEKQLRSGLARALNMKYLRLEGRSYVTT